MLYLHAKFEGINALILYNLVKYTHSKSTDADGLLREYMKYIQTPEIEKQNKWKDVLLSALMVAKWVFCLSWIS